MNQYFPNYQYVMLQNPVWGKIYSTYKTDKWILIYPKPKGCRYSFRFHIITNFQETTTCQFCVSIEGKYL